MPEATQLYHAHPGALSAAEMDALRTIHRTAIVRGRAGNPGGAVVVLTLPEAGMLRLLDRAWTAAGFVPRPAPTIEGAATVEGEAAQ